jgi:hypothetical protein
MEIRKSGLNQFMIKAPVVNSKQAPVHPLVRSLCIVTLFVCISLPSTFGGILTYQIEGSWAGVSSTVEFSGFVSHDTSSPDQLSQLNFGSFKLEDWNVLVDVNHGGIVTAFTPFEAGGGTGGEPSDLMGVASLGQGQEDGAILSFENAEGTQFGVTIGFQDADPNVPWVFPDGALLTFGFIEGIGFPDDINDSTMPMNPGSQITVIPEPSFVFVGAVLIVAAVARGWRHRGVRS